MIDFSGASRKAIYALPSIEFITESNWRVVMLVREIIQLKGGSLYTTKPQQALATAIDTMAELDVGSLVVMDAGKMVGMITFREVMRSLKQHGSNPDGVLVGDVMVKDPVTAFPDMEANDLRRLMIEKHSRYLPVIDGDQLMGVISFLDVAKAVLEEQSFENKMLKSYIKNWPGEGETPA
jgi:CBS domain-containing protein